MPFKALTYDVFHLGLYIVAALAWTALCVLVLLNTRRHMPGVSNVSSLATGAIGVVVCLGFLVADVLRLVEGHIVLFGLLIMGVIAPSLIAGVLYFCLSVQK